MKSLAHTYSTDPVRACRLALRRTLNVPERNRLEKINELLGLHGTEAICGAWQNGYWCDIVAAYANTGDTYGTTVLHVRGDWSGAPGRFMVGNVGDFVERNQEKLEIV